MTKDYPDDLAAMDGAQLRRLLDKIDQRRSRTYRHARIFLVAVGLVVGCTAAVFMAAFLGAWLRFGWDFALSIFGIGVGFWE